ncbi:protein phosphatase 2C domain-containing protein [Oleiagrimonas sp. C23AA]|uniref:PP2C family protein-serine/threonine phosphatase n=1 Tax=Oleiagrimonas sp. C23AA TaxID=2719047 RepID=UPI00141D9444|nr:protein phosphatase 2C domain-containing protein [Oleiagrimonas sp. C23AA]NII10293.1 serine/threonine-protein phosphatase [Oleiagrimonas sp. C23AA]
MIEFGHATHVGLRRKRNEDTYYADPGLRLFLVADGMGGHAHGELAATLARDGVVADMQRGQRLEAAIRQTDARIVAQRGKCEGQLPMGTTLAALKLDGEQFEVCWVGDSRVYLWHQGLKRLSHDHSLVQELVEQGVINDTQAREHPRRNVVTQALGVTAPTDLHVACVQGRLEPGMRFMLCTDGLTECLSDSQIAAIVGRNDLSAQECVDQLLLKALDAGAPDNVTVVLLRLATH